MSRTRLTFLAGGLVATALAFFLLGRAVRPTEDWSRQRINASSDPKEFHSRFLGLTVRLPAKDDWALTLDPAKFRFTSTAGLNKVFEMERALSPTASDRQWARMDLFVEPLYGAIDPRQVLKKLEFREAEQPGVGLRTIRPGYHTVEEGQATIGGKRGAFAIAEWTVGKKSFRAVNCHVEHDGRLFAFIGVCEAESFGRFRPVFDEIVASVRLR